MQAMGDDDRRAAAQQAVNRAFQQRLGGRVGDAGSA
jgi:hypothetical protein